MPVVQRAKKINGRKRHLATDSLGLMLKVEVHSAGIQDRDGAAMVFDRLTARFPFIEKFFADAGYQGPRVASAAPRPVEIIKRNDKDKGRSLLSCQNAGSSSEHSHG